MMAAQYLGGVFSLKELFADVVEIDADLSISMMTLDARDVKSGGLFFAVSGSNSHGMQYADQAIKNGASVIAFEPAQGGSLLARKYAQQAGVVLIEVEGLALVISQLASRFYQHPSRQLSVVGITGTNGKTSVSHYLAQAMQGSVSCGVIGTLGWGFLSNLVKTNNTTPDAVSTQAQLASLVNDSAEAVAVEVSSHGLQQHRVASVQFEGAVFTNLTHDHLDYHGSMEAYGEAKLELFKNSHLKYVVVNLDDSFSSKILDVLPNSVVVYGVTRFKNTDSRVNVPLFIQNERHDLKGLSFELGCLGETRLVCTKLLGDFNADNIACTLAVLLAAGRPIEGAVDSVKSIEAVAGRMEFIQLSEQLPSVVVDYAHTPDALASVLRTVRLHCAGKLIVIFGCGGDRDQGKRSLMGSVAGELADTILITSDNPRNESAGAIAEQIILGVADQAKVIREFDREQAIKRGVDIASSDDIIIVAGKGHEDYQLVGSERLSFSDAVVVRRALEARLEQEVQKCKH